MTKNIAVPVKVHKLLKQMATDRGVTLGELTTLYLKQGLRKSGQEVEEE